MINERISSARVYLEKAGVDSIVFLGLPNIRYLTGFTGSDGAFVLSCDKGWFLTDSRYTTQASMEVDGVDIVEYRTKKDGISTVIQDSSMGRVGLEAEHTSIAFSRSLAESLSDVEFLPIGNELDDLRMVKGDGEIETLAGCAGIASRALLGILDMIRPGVRECEIALELEFSMRRAGADGKAFDFIVASGIRGALPHGKAGEKTIEAGELVTIDFGAVNRGYHSDETVTLSLGSPDDRQKEIYNIVKDAHDMAIDAVRPGVSLKELDGIARGFIEKKGYGSYFGHGLGHGVGLEVHEKPTVSFRSEQIAESGMVFTIEPGIYIPEWGGVRIEDTIVVTDDGCRLLTVVPKGLMVL